MPRSHSPHIEKVRTFQKRKFAIRPHQVFHFAILVIMLLVAINIILIYLRYGLQVNSRFIDLLISLFYVDKEYNIPSYWSSLLLLSAALLLSFIFIQKHLLKDKYQYHWLVLACIFLLMSIDEYMALHERMIDPLRSYFQAGTWFHFTWVIPAMVAVVITGILFLPFVLHLRYPVRKMFFLSGIIYLGGALGVEMLGGYVTHAYGQRSLHYPITTTVEETLEMIGLAYFIFALLTYIRTDLDQKMQISLNKQEITAKNSSFPVDPRNKKRKILFKIIQLINTLNLVLKLKNVPISSENQRIKNNIS